MKLINKETCEVYWEHTAVTEVLPQSPYAQPPTLKVPGWIGLFGGQEHGQSIVGLELCGGGVIDEDSCRWVDYEVRLPSKDRSGVYNQIQIVRGAVGEGDVWAVEGGDTVFGLSPLTERWRFGRGLQGFGAYDQFEAGGMYVAHRDEDWDGPREIGGYLMWRPNCRTFFSWNYLHKSPLAGYPEADIQSLRMLCGPVDCFNAEVEIARDFGPYNDGRGKSAYRVGLFGLFPCDKGSMSFERVRAGPGFLGYYHNVDLTSGNVDAALTDSLRAGGCVTWYKQDLGEPDDFFSVLPDNRFYTAQLTYIPLEQIQCTLAGRVQYLRNRASFQSYNLAQKWADLRVGYSYPGFVATSSASLGIQDDRVLNKTTWPLQVYSLYGCWQRSSTFEWNLLAETGNIQYYDVRKWRTAVGGGFNWQLGPCTCLNCYGNIAANMPELCLFTHLSATLSHTRKNGHRARINTQYFACKLAAEPDDFRWFLSYDIPFDVIIPQEVQTGYVCGVVIDRDTQQPVEHAVVSLSGERTMTDHLGNFRFPAVDPGCYEVYADLLPQNYTVLGAQRNLVTVRKGKENRVMIETAQICRLQGRILQYDLADTLQAAEKFYLFTGAPEEDLSDCYVEAGGVSDIRITLYNPESRVSFTYRTSPRGHFRFDKLRPGTWTLYVEPKDIDAMHELPENSWEFTLEPGDEQLIEIKVVPKRGHMLSILEEHGEITQKQEEDER